ncbi:MAG TPA: class I SAM-dependent methyltransferase [Verrucomicrobiae bacterium]|nr:class I SAM-dependent methyltransferase [Verrucomicrobiae bacterium]
MKPIIVQPSEAYELIDSGNGLRLERFGQHTIVRPDPSVLWQPTTPSHPAWINPDATFVDTEKERWRLRKPQLANGWEVSFEGGAKVLVRPTPFRHVGVFPEQEANWAWLRSKLKRADKPKVLNLFGYTGVASIIAAQAGALVTHVDSSKSTVFWASDNAKRSALGEKGIRWMVDDVQKFVKRELRRGATYDLIIMDPPVFGRGAKGEVWRLEEHLGPLLTDIASLLSPNPIGFCLNFYATSLYPEAVARLTQEALGDRTGDLGLYSLCLGESESGKALPTGYCVRSE